MAVETGKLVLTKKGIVQIEINGKPFNPARSELSRSVLNELKALDGKEVEFERVNGQPTRIRKVGESFDPPQQPVRQAPRNEPWPSHGESPRSGGREHGRPTGHARDAQQNAPAGDFYNPYNFVPAPPRNVQDPDLGDHRPADHDAFLPDLFSGSIRVRMTAETPLLVPDTERVEETPNGHKSFHLRIDREGKPLVPASSVRGMLRSAYEAATNSRLGRFSHAQHGDRLAFRMDAREALRLIPARVVSGQLHLLAGTSRVALDGKPDRTMYAAWLPRYTRGQLVSANAAVYSNGLPPTHGEEVQCWLELFQHYYWDRNGNRHVPDFQYWRVRGIVRAGSPLPAAPGPSPRPPKKDGGSWHEPLPQPLQQAHGWVCVSNANINRKHDERVFFQGTTGAPGPFPVGEKHRRLWQELIQNYQVTHEEDLRRRRARGMTPDAYVGHTPGDTAWSRHVYTEADRYLSDGTLCYVRLNASQSDVEALFPVMIARELYPAAPWDLLRESESLRPATVIDELSPADRVFGWVRGDVEKRSPTKGERVATRGLLRVSPVRCTSSETDAVERFAPPGMPLAILAAPKSQQGRFYVARSSSGDAQQDGLDKVAAGYSGGKGLRGRKVYPHHKGLPPAYWEEPTEDRTQVARGGHYQEYRRPHKGETEWVEQGNRRLEKPKRSPDGSFALLHGEGNEQRDDQNRSVLGWVRPKAEFTFDLQVLNLSAVELGALLWLLRLPNDCFFRLGGGKPLGFGSVRLKLDSCDLRTGDHLRRRYAAWHEPAATASPNPTASVVTEYWKAVVRAYPSPAGSFDEVPFIKSFLAACRGHSLPVHYPRATPDGRPGPPSPDGESFKWFVANERSGARHALPDLAGGKALPTLRG